jgi:hypothetical protein
MNSKYLVLQIRVFKTATITSTFLLENGMLFTCICYEKKLVVTETEF